MMERDCAMDDGVTGQVRIVVGSAETSAASAMGGDAIVERAVWSGMLCDEGVVRTESTESCTSVEEDRRMGGKRSFLPLGKLGPRVVANINNLELAAVRAGPQHATLDVESSLQGRAGEEGELRAFAKFCVVDISKVDLENGLIGKGKVVTFADDMVDDPVCRICHSELNSCKETCIELGCACKEDLGRTHRQCAETWFKLKGNFTCEICGKNVKNLERTEPAPSIQHDGAEIPVSCLDSIRPARRCNNKPVRNFLLAILATAFLLPWLFRLAYFH